MQRTPLLLAFATGDAATCSFDFSFGAQCPPCKAFGSTLQKIYHADGIADACTWEFTHAIRTAGDPESDTAYDCPDEPTGCPSTAWVVCAFDQAQSVKEKMDFLGCWDESQDPEACASAAGLDYGAMTACQSGSKSAELRKAAAIKFENKWPTHAHGGMFHVPHVLANGKDMDDHSYSGLIKQLCSSGISAGACSQLEVTTSTQEDEPTTVAPMTTDEPTTDAPTTDAPTTAAPTTAAPTTTAAPKHTADITLGIVKGLLADDDDLGSCQMDAFSAGAMFGAAVEDLKAGKIVDACTDLSIALGKVQPLAGDCGKVKDEVTKLADELKHINPKSAAQNFKREHTAIMQDVADASAARDAEKYEEYGMHIGFALRRIIAEDGLIV